MSDRAGEAEDPREYWKRRSAGWTAGTATGRTADDSFDRALIAAAAIGPGDRVLDLAAGTGDPAITVASHVGSAGSVTALDLTFEMLQLARKRFTHLGLRNAVPVAGDMAMLPFPDATFDAVTCRNGLMFPPDRTACVREARRVLKPGGRAAWLAWGTIEENPIFLFINAALERYFGEAIPLRMARHALGAEGAIVSLLEPAGFRDIEERRIVYHRTVPAKDDYFRRAVTRTVPHRAGELTHDGWTAVLAAIASECATLREGDLYRVPVVARLGVGTAPG